MMIFYYISPTSKILKARLHVIIHPWWYTLDIIRYRLLRHQSRNKKKRRLVFAHRTCGWEISGFLFAAKKTEPPKAIVRVEGPIESLLGRNNCLCFEWEKTTRIFFHFIRLAAPWFLTFLQKVPTPHSKKCGWKVGFECQTAPSDCGFRTTHTAQLSDMDFGGFFFSAKKKKMPSQLPPRGQHNLIGFSRGVSIKVAWLQEAPVVVSAGSHGPGGPVGNRWVKNHIVFEKKSWNTPRSPYKSMSLEKKNTKKSNFDFKVVVVFVCQSRKEVARLAGCLPKRENAEEHGM